MNEIYNWGKCQIKWHQNKKKFHKFHILLREWRVYVTVWLEHPQTWTAGENGALDVDKDSCYLMPLSLTIMTKRMEPIWPALEKMMPIHAINRLPNPASFPALCSNFFCSSVVCNLWTQSFIRGYEAVDGCVTLFHRRCVTSDIFISSFVLAEPSNTPYCMANILKRTTFISFSVMEWLLAGILLLGKLSYWREVGLLAQHQLSSMSSSFSLNDWVSCSKQSSSKWLLHNAECSEGSYLSLSLNQPIFFIFHINRILWK